MRFYMFDFKFSYAYLIIETPMLLSDKLKW